MQQARPERPQMNTRSVGGMRRGLCKSSAEGFSLKPWRRRPQAMTCTGTRCSVAHSLTV
jgi:hypothetical protein